MPSVKKSVTIEEELDEKLRTHHEKYGSTDSGVIAIALKDYFKKVGGKK